MATHTFGTAVNPAHYIEIPDPVNAGQVKRPAAGTVLRVQNYATGAALPDAVAGVYGYFGYTVDVPQILVSGDNGTTWVGPLTSKEAITSSITAGVDASAALANSNSAVQVANQALQLVQAGGGGTGGSFTGTVSWLTQVTDRPSWLLTAPTAASVGALATSQRGAPEGVAALSGGLVPITQLPVGTSASQVAVGSHTHAQSWSGAPAGTVCVITETSAGVYPTPPTTRSDIVRWWRGSVRPTAAQGLQAGDEWRNTAS